jgi:hypothetical protein
MAASAGSPFDHVVAEDVAPTAPDLRCCTLQYTASVDLYDEIYEAFETIRLKDLHLGIKERSILLEMGARCVVMRCACRIFLTFMNSNDDQDIILTGETAASVGSHVNLMAGDEVAPAAPDMQRHVPQCSETVDSDGETFKAIKSIRLQDPHIGIKEYPITPDIDDGCVVLRCSLCHTLPTLMSRNNDVVLAGEAAASNGSRASFAVGGVVALTAPDRGHSMLPCSEIVDSDDETSKAFETIRLGDPYLRTRKPASMNRNIDMILVGKTASSNGSLVNFMAGDVVARAAPDVRRLWLQWSETVHLCDETSKAFLRLAGPRPRTRAYAAIPPKMLTRSTVFRFSLCHIKFVRLIGRSKIPSIVFFRRLEDLHMRITTFPIPSTMYARCIVFACFPCTGCLIFTSSNKHTMVLFWQTGVSKSSLVNILMREKVARPAPDTRRCLLQCTETIDMDDETSVKTIRLEDLHLGFVQYLSPPKMCARCVVF